MRCTRYYLYLLFIAFTITPFDLSQADTFSEPIAAWAGGAKKNALQWNGSRGSVQGRLHSNSDLNIGGNNHTFIGGVTSVGKIQSGGNKNIFDPGHQTTTAEAWPLPFLLEDYQPGGRAALEAGASYFDMSAVCAEKNKWRVGKKDDPVAGAMRCRHPWSKSVGPVHYCVGSSNKGFILQWYQLYFVH